jgi:preprotein translocase subunit YajC
VKYLPYLVVLVLLGGFLLVSVRNRKRQVADDLMRVSRIGVGTEVMTTSGLYGTVVAKHDDGTVVLSIAPGVEVKWAAAALRDADSLAEAYRRPLADGDPEHGADPGEIEPGDPAAPGNLAPPDGADLRKRGDDGTGS